MRYATVPAVVAGLLLLAACAQTPTATDTATGPGRTPSTAGPSPAGTSLGPTHTSTPAPSTRPRTPDLSQFTPPPSGLVDADTGETVTPRPVPSWDQASKTSAARAAVTVMRAFARPQADYDTWWAGLKPLLTEQAAEDYAYTDPANIPVRRVTGPGRLVDITSAYIARVAVPTDVGQWTVTLARTDAHAPWLGVRITPPEGIH
jgi:hypothetical protein